MAAPLAKFWIGGKLHVVSRFAECMFCGNVSKLLYRSTGRNNNLSPSRYLAASQYSSTVKAAESAEEPDDLFRQVTLEVKGHDKAVINSYSQFVSLAASELGVNLAKIFEPPKDIRRYTILKSVHIYSKHMVQYEARTHYRVFELKHLTGSTADTFLEYIQRNLPEGMAMKVTKDRIERIPDHLKPPKATAATTTQSSDESS